MEAANAVRGIGEIGTVCEECVDGKEMNKLPRSHEKSTKNVIELMLTDLSGPVNPEGLNGEKYVQLLVDDYAGVRNSSP